jgi:hypothetical protein
VSAASSQGEKQCAWTACHEPHSWSLGDGNVYFCWGNPRRDASTTAESIDRIAKRCAVTQPALLAHKERD